MNFKFKENNNMKELRSEDYNFLFDKQTGFFARWGKTPSDNPQFSPFGPELLDVEISEICSGINNVSCSHCYKSNSFIGENMSLETMKSIISVIPKTITQIAYGIGNIDGNPDLWEILNYTREQGIIPNITINGWNLQDSYAKNLHDLCGAVAVSRYSPKDVCYDAIKKLTDLGMKQVNIHQLLSEETYDSCFELIDDIKNDPRLEKLNAVVFLSLKPKGRGNKLTPIKDIVKYKVLINALFDNQIRWGADSCAAYPLLYCFKDTPKYKYLEQVIEACESSLFSLYINVKGQAFPCSFMEGEGDWTTGLDVVNKDFIKDVWNNSKLLEFRKSLTDQKFSFCDSCRACPHHDMYPEELKLQKA